MATATTDGEAKQVSVPLSAMDDDEMINEQVAARFLGTTPGNLQQQRCAKKKEHPPYAKLGNSVRYRVGDLREWIKSRTIRHSDPGE